MSRVESICDVESDDDDDMSNVEVIVNDMSIICRMRDRG